MSDALLVPIENSADHLSHLGLNLIDIHLYRYFHQLDLNCLPLAAVHTLNKQAEQMKTMTLSTRSMRTIRPWR